MGILSRNAPQWSVAGIETRLKMTPLQRGNLMGTEDDDNVSEEGYDPGEDDGDGDDEAERFILDVEKEGDNQ